MRDGFHYFSPPGTPHYPGFHHLGTRDWTVGERNPEPLLGEWNGARKWYDGSPPARVPLPVLVGDADCIAAGERPGLPIVADRSAFCGKILPDLCYGAENELLANTNVFDCVFAKVCADIISAAYTDLPAALSAAQAFLGPDATVTSFDDPDPLLPDGVIAVIGTTAIVWLTGTTTPEQLAVQGLFFGSGPQNQGAYSTTTLYEAAAIAIAARLNAAGGGEAVRVVLAGHSYGGAVCMVLAAKMQAANPGRKVELLTLGAPAPGDERIFNLNEQLRQTHYANERDPIPYMPPSGLTLAAISLLIGPVLALTWTTFRKPSHVKQITQDGQFIDVRGEGLPDDLLISLGILIAQVRAVPRFKDHGVDWYSYYLCLACGCVPKPCVPPPDEGIMFDFELVALEFEQALTPFTESYTRNALDTDSPLQWFALEAGFERVRITTTIDENGVYGDFTVSYFFGDFGNIAARFDWTFTAAEMFMGIDTSDFPVMFSLSETDHVVSLGELKIVPTLI